jgi:hypothetical protein
MSSKGRVKPSLATLSRESIEGEEASKFFDELIGSNDRASAVLGAAMVERLLIILAQTKMRMLSKTESDALFFDRGAPLQSFSARIEIAYAIEAITKEEKQHLDEIRRIRNVFAHALRPITFENALVISACVRLPNFTFAKNTRIDALSPHKQKFISVTAGIAKYFKFIINKHPRAEQITKLVPITNQYHGSKNTHHRFFPRLKIQVVI